MADVVSEAPFRLLFPPKRDEVRNEACSWSREAGIRSRNKIGG